MAIAAVAHGSEPGVKAMTYVISEPCIGAKDMSCAEAVPVDRIHQTPDVDVLTARANGRPEPLLA
jgi:hypothetical protein